MPRPENPRAGGRGAGRMAKLYIDREHGEVWTVEASGEENRDDCLMTPWSVSHLVCYFTVGLCVPSMWWFALLLSGGWEAAEYFAGCHDLLDPLVNTVGISLGMSLREWLTDI